MSTHSVPDAAALSVEGLHARYGRSITALTDISLVVEPGEVVTLMGLNGAGKSTLSRAITGLLPAQGGSITAGTIHSFGADITRRSPRRIVRHGVAQALEGRRIFGASSSGSPSDRRRSSPRPTRRSRPRSRR